MFTEDENWENLRAGDLAAFTSVYKSYYQFLFADGYRKTGDAELIKDCIHELFLELWQKRSALAPVQHVGGYLKTILTRKLARERVQLPLPGFAGEPELLQPSYEDLLIGLQQTRENQEKVRNALKQLSPSQLEIIRLRFFENHSYEDIAGITRKSPRTIYNQVFTALSRLRKLLRVMLLLLSFYRF